MLRYREVIRFWSSRSVVNAAARAKNSNADRYAEDKREQRKMLTQALVSDTGVLSSRQQH